MNWQKKTKLLKLIKDIDEFGFRTIHSQHTQRCVKEQNQRVSRLKRNDDVVLSFHTQDVSMIILRRKNTIQSTTFKAYCL